MQCSKVSCPQCRQYSECPQKTRLFVNYCGANNKQVEDNVRTAILDCKTRQGKLFKRNTISKVSSLALLLNAEN